MCIHIYIYMYICKCTCLHMIIYTCTYAYMCVPYTYIHIFVYICVPYIYIHIYIYIYIYIYVYAYTYIWTCTCIFAICFLLSSWVYRRARDKTVGGIVLHEKLLRIQRVSNPPTENQRISTPAHSNGWKWEIHVSSELMVQIKQKGVYGVENPLPRSFLGGGTHCMREMMTSCSVYSII